MKILIIPAIIISLAFGGYVGYFVGAHGTEKISTIGASVSQDPVLVSDAKQLGLDYSNVNLNFASNLSAPDVPHGPTIGLFTPPNIIQVKQGLTKSQEIQTVAYEFMHYYWQNLPSSSRQQMGGLYQQYYDSNQSFKELTQDYVGPADTLADERNSTACTEIPPYALTNEFNSYCNRFIPNRSILFAN